jgi:hypothetical protein
MEGGMSDVMECRTAADVRMAALLVKKRREQWRAPKLKVEMKASIVPIDQIQLNGPVFGWFNGLATSGAAPKITISRIQNAVCAYAMVSICEMTSQRRSAGIVKIRQIGVILSRILTVCSTTQIGARFGCRDHSTVIYTCKRLGPFYESMKGHWRLPLDEIVAIAFEAFDDFKKVEWQKRRNEVVSNSVGNSIAAMGVYERNAPEIA